MDWHDLFKNTNRRIVTVFIIYLCNLIVFSIIYQAIYKSNPESFAFNSDIQKSQSAFFKNGAEKEIVDLQIQFDDLKQISNQLNSITGPIKVVNVKRGLIPFSFPQVEFETSAHKIVFRTSAETVGEVAVRVLMIEFYDHQGNLIVSYNIPPSVSDNLPDQMKDYQAVVLYLSNYIEGIIHENQRRLSTLGGTAPEVWSYWDFLYFSIITQSTVGYGDILPNSTKVRVTVSMQILIGMLLLVVIINLVFQKSVKK